jgi:hypothetical protein
MHAHVCERAVQQVAKFSEQTNNWVAGALAQVVPQPTVFTILCLLCILQTHTTYSVYLYLLCILKTHTTYSVHLCLLCILTA